MNKASQRLSARIAHIDARSCARAIRLLANQADERACARDLRTLADALPELVAEHSAPQRVAELCVWREAAAKRALDEWDQLDELWLTGSTRAARAWFHRMFGSDMRAVGETEREADNACLCARRCTRELCFHGTYAHPRTRDITAPEYPTLECDASTRRGTICATVWIVEATDDTKALEASLLAATTR